MVNAVLDCSCQFARSLHGFLALPGCSIGTGRSQADCRCEAVGPRPRLHEMHQCAPMKKPIRAALPPLALLISFSVAGQNSAKAADDTIPTLATAVKIES